MDPIKFLPVEVIEIIFGFLSGREVLECSKVSPDWNNVIGSSMKCMQNVTLKMSGRHWENCSEDFEENFPFRKFSNIFIFDGAKILPLITEVMMRTLHWKSVTIFNTEFESTENFIKICKIFESTVEKIVLHEVKILKPDNTEVEIRMKNLKHVSVCCVDSSICEIILQDSPLLESLTLGNFSSKFETKNILENLKTFKNLKKLIASPEWFKPMFETSEKFNFRLESLSIASNVFYTNTKSFKLYRKTQSNFYEFLSAQGNSLKTLSLVGLYQLKVAEIAFQMPTLQEFILPFLSMNSTSNLDFAINKSIKTLDVSTFNNDKGRKLFQVLSTFAPKVENFRINGKPARNMDKILKKLQVGKKLSDEAVKEVLSNKS